MRPPVHPRRRHSFSSLIISYMIFVLVVSGILTGISCILLIFFGFIPGILLGHMMTPLMPIPMIIIFLFARKYIISGMSRGGIKG